MRKRPWLLVSLSLGLAAAGCTHKGGDDVILIGEVGSMTGADATFGQSSHQGSQLAFDEINAQGGIHGKKLKLVTVDDQGKASEAALAVTRLITSDHVAAILGEVASTRSLAMAPIAQQYKIPMITPSSINAKITQQGDYIFRVCFVDEFQSHVMAGFARQNLGAKRVALLTDTTSDYSVDSARIFKTEFTKSGGEIAVEQSYSGGDIQFKSQLIAIRAKNPELIVVPGYYTDVALIARQVKELGMNIPLLGGDGWDSPKLKEIGGGALDGSFFISHFSQKDPQAHVQKFVKAYEKAYGGIPDGIAALGYDAARVLAEALDHAPAANPQALRDAIAATKDFTGITGKITMGPDRNAIKAAVVFKLVEGGSPSIITTLPPKP